MEWSHRPIHHPTTIQRRLPLLFLSVSRTSQTKTSLFNNSWTPRLHHVAPVCGVYGTATVEPPRPPRAAPFRRLTYVQKKYDVSRHHQSRPATGIIRSYCPTPHITSSSAPRHMEGRVYFVKALDCQNGCDSRIVCSWSTALLTVPSVCTFHVSPQ